MASARAARQKADSAVSQGRQRRLTAPTVSRRHPQTQTASSSRSTSARPTADASPGREEAAAAKAREEAACREAAAPTDREPAHPPAHPKAKTENTAQTAIW